MEIVLVRHGETQFNRLGVFRGRADVELNERGREQARCVARALGATPIAEVFSSPLRRALDTARVIAREHGLETRVEQAFNNIDLGEWQGVEKAVVERDYPDLWKIWVDDPERLAIPGGETLADVRKRTHSRALELVDKYREKRICIVSHRSALKVLAAALLGFREKYYWKLYLDNAAYSVLGHDERKGFILIRWNENCHLKGRVVEVF